jgi:hypothetical protein
MLDLVKGHLVPHIVEKKTIKEMYDSLIILYKNVSLARKMLLKNMLTTTSMNDIETLVAYLMITVLQDHLATIEVEEEELMPITLKGFFILGTICLGFLCL